jgi:hypothetical protein
LEQLLARIFEESIMDMEKVFPLIAKERGHQNVDLGYDAGGKKVTFDDLNHTAQWAIYVHTYAERALSKFLGGAGGLLDKIDYEEDPENAQRVHEREVLKDLVKVAALCVACLEHKGELLEE